MILHLTNKYKKCGLERSYKPLQKYNNCDEDLIRCKLYAFAGSLIMIHFILKHFLCPLNRANLANFWVLPWKYTRDFYRIKYRVSQKKRSLRIFTPLGATDASGDNSVGQGCWGDVGWWLGGGGCTRWRTGRCTRWRTRSTRKTRRFTRWRSRSLRKSARTWSGVEFRVKSDRVISSSILCTSLPFLHLVYLLVYHHLSIQHLPDNLYECFCLYSLQLRLLFSVLVRSFSYLATSLVMLSFTFWI